MVGFIEAAKAAVKSTVCPLLADDGVIGGFLAEAGVLAGSIGVSAGAFRRQYCNDPSEPPPPSGGYSGGQCPVLYGIYSTRSWTGTTLNTGPGMDDGLQGQGNVGPYGPVFTRRDDQRQATDYFVTDGTGQEVLFIVHPDTLLGFSYTLRFERVDGQPDNCGSLPTPNYPKVPSADSPITINYDNSTGGSFTAVGTLRLFAPVFLPGSFAPTFPFNLDLGGLNLTGNFDFNGEIAFSPTINFGAGNGANGGDESPDEPEDSEARVIIGARVFSTVNTNEYVGRITQDENPDIYIPRLGSVHFRQRVGRGSAWTKDLDVKALVQYIACPDPGEAIAVKGTGSPGVSLQITPIYKGPPRI